MVLSLQTTYFHNKNNFHENFNDKNYKITVSKLHDYGWKNSYFTSDDVDMLSCGCGVSINPQLYDQSLEKYQVLPRTYLGGFKGGNGEKWQNKNGC